MTKSITAWGTMAVPETHRRQGFKGALVQEGGYRRAERQAAKSTQRMVRTLTLFNSSKALTYIPIINVCEGRGRVKKGTTVKTHLIKPITTLRVKK